MRESLMRLAITSCVVFLAVVGIVAVGLTGSTGVASADPPTQIEVDDEVYTNGSSDTLRLIAGGSPVDESAFDGELNETVRGPLVREPRRPLTVDQAVERSAFVDGYRTQLDEQVYIPTEDEWVLLDEFGSGINPVRQWVSGIGNPTLQSTEHPDKSLTVDVAEQEDGFSSDAPVRNALIEYNETDDSFAVVNPGRAEVQNESGVWFRYTQLPITDTSFNGFEPINAAATEVNGQNMRVDTSDSIGFMQIRNAQIVWEDASTFDRVFDYSSGFSIANEGETEIYDGSYMTYEQVQKDAVGYDSISESVVPQVGGEDRWSTGDGGEATLQSGDTHEVVRDHWTGVAHLNPGSKFEGEIDGVYEVFYIADPDGFEVYAPHDFRVDDPPTNDDGSTEEEWTREDVDHTVEAINGDETVTGGPWLELSGGADGLKINSTVTVTYTREWGSVGGELDNNETVKVTSTQEVDVDLRASVKEPVDITMYVVSGGQTDEILYEIEGRNNIEDAPISEISVDVDGYDDLDHTVTLPWQFVPLLDYDTVETRTTDESNSQFVNLDPNNPPWSTTTDHVSGGSESIQSDVFGSRLEPADKSEISEYNISLREGVADRNRSVSVPTVFGSDASALQRNGDLAELEDANLDAKTIFGSGVDGDAINSTKVEYVEYFDTNIRATYYTDEDSGEVTIQILLENEFGIPMSDRTLNISGAEEQTVTTDEDGRAEVVPIGKSAYVAFDGDLPDVEADALYAQSDTTVHDTQSMAREGDVYDSIVEVMAMVVFLSPVFAFGIALVIWRITFGK